MTNNFKRRTNDENAQAIADLLPSGNYWNGKNIQTSNFRKLLRGLGSDNGNLQALNQDIATSYIPNDTSLLNEYWEEFLGIPDNCFKKANVDDGDRKNFADRRRDIIIKYGKMKLDNQSSYFTLADALGIKIEINNSTDGFYTFHWQIKIFGVEDLDGWDYDWDINWAVEFKSLIECIFKEQRPSHTLLIFTYVTP